MSAYLLATTACVEDPDFDTEEAASVRTLQLSQDDVSALALDALSEDEELVFAQLRELAPGGETRVSVEVGALDDDIRMRVARPWSYVHEPYLYAEFVRSSGPLDEQEFEPGTTADTELYIVSRRINPEPYIKEPNLEPLQVDDAFWEIVDRVAKGGPISDDSEWLPDADALALEPGWLILNLRARDFPDWDLPLRLYPQLPDSEAAEAVEQSRAARMAERLELLRSTLAPTLAIVEHAGGRVISEHPGSGWVSVEVPASVAYTLAERPELSGMHGPGEGAEGSWRLGEGRWSARLDADRFIDAGHDGSYPNPDFPWATSRVVIAIGESESFLDTACMFRSGSNCGGATRVFSRFRCNFSTAPICRHVSSFSGDTDYRNHGTWVASAALGSYMQGQACGHEMGDPSWTSGCHSPLWERNRTGMAPGAAAMLLGEADSSTNLARYAAMIEQSAASGADIFSGSWWRTRSGGGDYCNIVSNSIIEQAVENAYDDGLFIAMCSGNKSTPGEFSSICDVRAPGDTPKAFSVAGFNVSEFGGVALDPNCHGDVRSCRLSPIDHRRGGATARINGTNYSGAISVIAAVAPTRMGSVTGAGNMPYGEPTSTGAGCSTATPHVAGLAAVVKSWLIERGSNWIQSPGRLHTVMLAMTDTHRSTTATGGGATYATGVGTDPWWGLGRPRLRLFEVGQNLSPYAFNIHTRTFMPGDGAYTYQPFGSTVPTAAQEVKCVSWQHEAMSNSSNPVVSHLHLRMRFYSGATLMHTVTDNSRDIKKMGRRSGSIVQGRSVEVSLIPQWIENTGVTVSTFCSYSSKQSDAS